MIVPVFVDTNVLVSARDASAGDKQVQARNWMAHLWSTGRGRLSFQVLDEYYVVVTRKLKPGLEPEEARNDVRDLLAWQPQPVDGDVVEAAWDVEDRFGLSFWDALIVSAAQIAGCRYVLTEDLQHGQALGAVTVLNPFVAEPAAAT